MAPSKAAQRPLAHRGTAPRLKARMFDRVQRTATKGVGSPAPFFFQGMLDTPNVRERERHAPVATEDERIEQLELKLAYLERSNQELGDVVYRQQQALDALRARLERLADQLKEIEEGPRGYTAEEEQPPHY